LLPQWHALAPNLVIEALRTPVLGQFHGGDVGRGYWPAPTRISADGFGRHALQVRAGRAD
jgi:hypothetical protein